jgi:shikimate dehydrogenase
MRAAVLGWPIAHSLSPTLHRAAYAALGLDWQYDGIAVASGELEAFVRALGPEWAGLSLTMPLKQEVLPLLHERSRLVEITGAANTVVVRKGELTGHNTDVAGMVSALREAGIEHVDRAAVIGAGATAASAVVALHDLGCHQVRVLARSTARARVLEPVAAAVGVELRFGELHPLEIEDRWPQLVISTVPAGAVDDWPNDPTGEVPLLDVVYVPWPTPLAAAYLTAGATVVGGAEMLLHQAAAQVELMTGRQAPLEAMRAALPTP